MTNILYRNSEKSFLECDKNDFKKHLPVPQAATILGATVSGKNFWRPKFWRKLGDGDHFTVKGELKPKFMQVFVIYI